MAYKVKLLIKEVLSDLPNKTGVYESFLGKFEDNCLKLPAFYRHYRRFKESFSKLSFEDLCNHIKNVSSILIKIFPDIKKNGKFIRYRLWKGYSEELLVEASNFLPRYSQDLSKRHADLVSVNFCRHQSIKYTPAKESTLSFLYALRNHNHEALLINENNLITEASWSNFFWINNNCLYTPTFGLKGIAQQIILELVTKKNIRNLNFKRANIALDSMIKNRYPCFLTNAIYGVTPVRTINSTEMKNNPILLKLAKCYNKLIHTPKEVTWIPIDS